MNAMTALVGFDTALGPCAVRWGDHGITGVLLPVRQGRPIDDPLEVPAFVRHAISGMVAVLAGEAIDLRDVPIDHRDVDDFRRAVYTVTRTIPPGSTRSYGEIARALELDRPNGAREVGPPWHGTRRRSSSRATASSRRTAVSRASRRPAGWPPSGGCSSWRACRDTASRRSSAEDALRRRGHAAPDTLC
jgi:hypothetical protein